MVIIKGDTVASGVRGIHHREGDAYDQEPDDRDPGITRADSHGHGNSQDDEGSVLGIPNHRAEPYDPQRPTRLNARATLSPITCVTIAIRTVSITSVPGNVRENSPAGRGRR